MIKHYSFRVNFSVIIGDNFYFDTKFGIKFTSNFDV